MLLRLHWRKHHAASSCVYPTLYVLGIIMHPPLPQPKVQVLHSLSALSICGPPTLHTHTQVPQFLLEAGFGCSEFPERAGRIGVTQPRRVAATSTAERVASELGERLGQTVGYQVGWSRGGWWFSRCLFACGVAAFTDPYTE
jgi:hypothetical protein